MFRQCTPTKIRRPILCLAGAALLLSVVSATAQETIIIDHKCTKGCNIPDYWIEQAKALTIHYAHTSHGGQITSGLAVLESTDGDRYTFARREATTEGLPPIEDPPALRMYDGNPPETYITPEDYWATSNGINRTRAVAATENYDYSMWSWCGQQSTASEAYTQAYLDTMAQFEVEYSAMRFILMTGHTDGSGEGGTLHARNNQVRDFANANGMIVFDFADIESYDPDWNYYLDLDCEDDCDYWIGTVKHNWADEWCAAHPGDDLCAACSCNHSKPLNCNLKARAFWWMMARLAGWPGPPASDQDRDGDVDLTDFTLLSDCLAGPGVSTPPGTCTTEKSDQADVDGDGDVDLDDFNVFQGCFAGADTPPNEP